MFSEAGCIRPTQFFSEYVPELSGIVIKLVFKLYNFQMTSSDKDFRFMATNDLMAELQKDSIKLDDDSERIRSVCTAS